MHRSSAHARTRTVLSHRGGGGGGWTMDSHAYFMKETASSLGIRGGTGPQCPMVTPPISNSAILRGKLDAQVGQNFLAAAIFPRKCGRCVKIERQNFLGKIVAATEFPGDRIPCDTGSKRNGPASFKGRRYRTRGRSQCVLVKIWRTSWNTYLVRRLNVVVR